jgi:tetratricopeptide (TPR) repeat protein
VRDVFISYAREDKPKAELIAQALVREDLSVWWDRNIPPGQSYGQMIEQALDSAKCIIVLWSKQSVASDWVKDEAAEGVRRRILVPVMIEEVIAPLGFRQFQTANLIGWEGDSAHPELHELLDVVSAQVGRGRSRTEPVTPAACEEAQQPVPKASQPASGIIFEATGLNNQAELYRDQGRLEEAFELFKKVEALCLELGNKDGLLASYGNQASILAAWGRLEEAFELFKKVEALCLELGNKDGLQRSYGSQALILAAWGRLEEAFELLKKQEALCLELGNKDGLQRSYGSQALILKAWGRLEEALALLKKVEALCLELEQGRSAGKLWQPGLDPGRLGSAGGGFGAAQETGSALPGAGQSERAGLLLRELGPSGARTA